MWRRPGCRISLHVILLMLIISSENSQECDCAVIRGKLFISLGSWARTPNNMELFWIYKVSYHHIVGLAKMNYGKKGVYESHKVSLFYLERWDLNGFSLHWHIHTIFSSSSCLTFLCCGFVLCESWLSTLKFWQPGLKFWWSPDSFSH